MEKQYNRLFWHAVFVAILLGIGFGTYFASKSIDYTWRWERIPQYLINTEPRAGIFVLLLTAL